MNTKYRIHLIFKCDCEKEKCFCFLDEEKEIYINKDYSYKVYNSYITSGKWVDKEIKSIFFDRNCRK